MGQEVDIGTLDYRLKLALISVNILVTIFAICGNGVAVVVAFKSRWTSSPTKLFLISLSLSDLFLTLTATPVDLDQLLDSFHAWVGVAVEYLVVLLFKAISKLFIFEPPHLGGLLCRFIPFFHFMFLLVNSFSLLALILQRYWSTSIVLASHIYNRAENSSKTMTAVTFSFIWFIPLGFSVPYMDVYSLSQFNCTITRNTTVLAAASNSVETTTDMYYLNSMETTGTSPGPGSLEFDDEFDTQVYCYSMDNEKLLDSSEPKPSATVAYGKLFDGTTLKVKSAESNDNDSIPIGPSVSQTITICEQTKPAHGILYHIATGLIFIIIIIAYFWGYNYFRRMRKVQDSFESALAPVSPPAPVPLTPSVPIITSATTTLSPIPTTRTRTSVEIIIPDDSNKIRNGKLLFEIRKMLARQRRGIRLIQQLMVIFVVCRLPLWLFTIINDMGVLTRTSLVLGIYYSLHLLANVKSAVTPFLYAHASQSAELVDSKYGSGSDKLGYGYRKRSKGSNPSSTDSTLTTTTTMDVGRNQMILNESITHNNRQIQSAQKMTEPFEVRNYLSCHCFLRRKSSSTYILEGA